MKQKYITLTIPSSCIVLDNSDGTKGYFLGELRILPNYSFHVEAIEVKRTKTGGVSAVNADYQGRIDDWMNKNECCTPRLYMLNRKKYFIHIETYAA